MSEEFEDAVAGGGEHEQPAGPGSSPDNPIVTERDKGTALRVVVWHYQERVYDEDGGTHEKQDAVVDTYEATAVDHRDGYFVLGEATPTVRQGTDGLWYEAYENQIKAYLDDGNIERVDIERIKAVD